MNPYEKFVSDSAAVLKQGLSLPLGGLVPLPRPKIAPDAPQALILSPHPDDEVIIGGLPLRLLRELNWNVVNVAVTQGSNRARQAERLQELRACCHYIGFGLEQTTENGLEDVNVESRRGKPAEWERAVARIADLLRAHSPRVIFFPHANDWNSTHIGTHYLMLDALGRLGASFPGYIVETEFWAPMASPNLMVESSERDVIDLLAALSFHVGEVRRNPYHARLPAWLVDNVRRGAELVGGQGAAAPAFTFATLYRLSRWKEGRLEPVLERGQCISCADDLAALFAL